MRLGHTPYGYRIENGAAVINEEEAEKVRTVFRAYISGRGFRDSAGAAGLEMTHTSVKRLLRNRHYIGDDFYPAIVGREEFDAAGAEHRRRLETTGKVYGTRKSRTGPGIRTAFIIRPAVRKLKDPYEQAEYIYSLIESEG